MLGISSDVESKWQQAQQRKLCKVGDILLKLTPEDAEAVVRAVELVREDADRPQADRFFTVVWLQKDVLTSNGFPIGKTVVSEHVRKVCACEQAGQ